MRTAGCRPKKRETSRMRPGMGLRGTKCTQQRTTSAGPTPRSGFLIRPGRSVGAVAFGVQLDFGCMPKFDVATLGFAGLFPQQVRVITNLLFGRHFYISPFKERLIRVTISSHARCSRAG